MYVDKKLWFPNHVLPGNMQNEELCDHLSLGNWPKYFRDLKSVNIFAILYSMCIGSLLKILDCWIIAKLSLSLFLSSIYLSNSQFLFICER